MRAKTMPNILNTQTSLAFKQAIESAKKRGIVLPNDYYTKIFGGSRAKYFSISTLKTTASIRHVMDSLESALSDGQSFQAWKKEQQKNSGELLHLSKQRKELIFRNAMMTAYAEGRCAQFKENEDTHPYLLYLTVGDARVRDEHAGMHNYVAKKVAKIWRSWFAPNGHGCRCTVMQLTEKQAMQRIEADKAELRSDKEKAQARIDSLSTPPDWNYSVCSESNKPAENAVNELLDKAKNEDNKDSLELEFLKALLIELTEIEEKLSDKNQLAKKISKQKTETKKGEKEAEKQRDMIFVSHILDLIEGQFSALLFKYFLPNKVELSKQKALLDDVKSMIFKDFFDYLVEQDDILMFMLDLEKEHIQERMASKLIDPNLIKSVNQWGDKYKKLKDIVLSSAGIEDIRAIF